MTDVIVHLGVLLHQNSYRKLFSHWTVLYIYGWLQIDDFEFYLLNTRSEFLKLMVQTPILQTYLFFCALNQERLYDSEFDDIFCRNLSSEFEGYLLNCTEHVVITQLLEQ